MYILPTHLGRIFSSSKILNKGDSNLGIKCHFYDISGYSSMGGVLKRRKHCQTDRMNEDEENKDKAADTFNKIYIQINSQPIVILHFFF
jgi:hypothetical protein